MKGFPLPNLICAWCKQPIDLSKRGPRYPEVVRRQQKKGVKRFYCRTDHASKDFAYRKQQQRGAA